MFCSESPDSARPPRGLQGCRQRERGFQGCRQGEREDSKGVSKVIGLKEGTRGVAEKED